MIARTALAAATYGFSIGLVHSLRFALRNLIKFPLLLLVTGGVCGVCYYLLARFCARELELRAVGRATLTIYHDTSILLVSLSPITLFLALTIERPTQRELHEYPLFLGMNVVLIGVSGSLALLRQCKQLLLAHGVPLRRGVPLVAAWLAASLFVGAEAAWFMRPFCGVSSVEAPFMLGSAPDFRGDTSFYQALYHLLAPPAQRFKSGNFK